MATVYIGVGSNLGDREGNCLRALALMAESGLVVTKRSSMHETEPWGILEQPRFINMVVSVKTNLDPVRLLALLKDIEKLAGRKETVKYGPRTLDIDMLLYDSLVVKEPALEIPHPLMHERGFVLAPLAEIAPDVIHPVLKKTVLELKENLSSG